MSNARTIDVHAHFLPPVYLEALRDAGLKTVDGGIALPPWSPAQALECELTRGCGFPQIV